MLVRILKYWPEQASHMGLDLNLEITRQTPKSSLRWGEIEFTLDDVDECDLLVVLGFIPKNLKIKARQIWLLQQEPPLESVWGWSKSSYKYFDKVFGFWDEKNIIKEQTSLPWFIKKTYDELVCMHNESKQDRVSFCTSNLAQRPGHIARLAFKDFLIEQNFDFDLYGQGFNQINDKFDAINPYKYSIAIENYFADGYWTEKISDCFLCGTMPIYAGAPDVLKYFPQKSLVLIDPNQKQKSYEKILEAIDNNFWDNNIEYVKEAKDLCLNKYQLFPNIERLFSQYQVMENPIKTYTIPKTQNFEESGMIYTDSFSSY